MVSMGLEDVLVAQAQDEVLWPIMIALQLREKMPAGLPRGLQQFFLLGQVLCRKFQETDTTKRCTQIVIPKSLIQAVLKQLHDQAGHLGIFKTTEKVKECFYWPEYEQDIRTWVQNCVQCRQCNPPIPQAQAPLGTIQASYPFEKMSWDIMGPMPVTGET